MKKKEKKKKLTKEQETAQKSGCISYGTDMQRLCL